MDHDNDSHRMGLAAATAMSVTIVVGAGLLTLPGLSYAQAGRLGHLPWLLMSVLMLPLLAVFAFFARRHPSAGGVVGYIRLSLGPRLGAASEAIVIGTFSLGLPAIALIGATYLQQTLPGLPVGATAIGMVTIGLLFGMFGLRVSGAIQTAIATLIVLGLLGLCAGYWLHAPSDNGPDVFPLAGNGVLPMDALLGVLSALPLVLFAYTGWEITAFLAEDMRDPARNLPRSIWASFVIVTLLYVFVAWTVASAATADDGWRLAPIARLAESWLGVAGLRLTGIIATLLILANVTGAFLSTSRALFSAGRDGLLPQALAQVDGRGLPVRAMLTGWVLYVVVILVTQTSGLGVETLLQLAGQNFFVLYLLAAVGYTRLQQRTGPRLLGLVAILLVLAMMTLFSLPGILYCGALALLGLWGARKVPLDVVSG
ncbi:APC family permease [Lautropia mirabilis]|nr:APC family permease [Lautropia mirabilis]